MNDLEEKANGSHLAIVDAVVIVIYFLFVISVGIWTSKRSKKQTISDYFLASRNMHWIPVGASLFASNVGSGHFIGLAGSAAATGIAVAGFELTAIFTITLLGWVFVPIYKSSGIYTMPEYLRERFGGQRIRLYLSFLSLILYIFTKISADLYAGALFIQLALNKTSPEWLYISIFMLLGISAVFTITGGLTAVIWTDFVQTILMIIGTFILMGISFAEVGGYQKLIEKYPYAVATIRSRNGTCGIPPSDYMNLLRSPVPGVSDIPWTGITFGLASSSIWYFCTDQVIVQRVLASKNLIHAKAGCILASYLKLLPLWLLVFPGMAARVLFPDRVGCADPEECTKICGSPGGCTNIAFAELVIKLLPSGLSGLMLSVMMAALMTSLTSIFNSASTIFTIDVWTRFRKSPSDAELIIVGRVFIVILVIISVLWIPVIQNDNNAKLFDYMQSIMSFLAPSIASIFLLAIFWTRTTEPGAFWGLMVGLGMGFVRFTLEFTFPAPSCWSERPDPRPTFIILTVGKVHYLHFSCFLFIVTTAVAVAVSLLTKPIPEEHLYRLTYWTKKSLLVRRKINEKKSSSINQDKSSTKRNEDRSFCVKLLYRIVGTSSSAQKGASDISTQDAQNSNNEEEIARKAVESISQDPKWKRIVNFNAVVCICITIFIWGFYA